MIEKKDFETLAKLCKLEFSEEEEEKFIRGFDEIIGFANRINTDVEGDALSIKEVGGRSTEWKDLREDTVEESLPCEKIASNVSAKDGYFPIKRVVK